MAKSVKGVFLVCLLIAFAGFFSACNGEEGGGDGDVQEEDVLPEDIQHEDIRPEEVTVDEVPVEEDVVEVEAEDVTAEEIIDITVEEEVPACSTTPKACGDEISGSTTATGILDGYVCNGRPVDYMMSGGEDVYEFTPTSSGKVLLTLSYDTQSAGLVAFVLTGRCDPATCISSVYDVGVFDATAGTTYYIVVDTYREYPGAYTLTIDCTGANLEDCTNGTDDNNDDYIDCEDSQCMMVPPCFEPICDDNNDDDGDGRIDCADYDCFGAIACRGGSGDVGDPCARQDDCSSGQCITEADVGFPSGYCTVLNQDKDCTELACPAGSTCVELGWFGGPPSGCFTDCSSSSCRDAYECDTSDNTCWPACTANTQCTVTNYCNTERGRCEIHEFCNNTTDDDGDTFVDCEDPDCYFVAPDCYEEPTSLPGGDTCANVVALTLPDGERGTIGVTGTTTGTTDDYEPGCQSMDSLDVVYSFTLTNPADVIVDLVGSGSFDDTVLFVKSGDCATGTEIACNDDFGDNYNHSQVTLTNLSAGTYYIFVDGYDGSAGDYTLALRLTDPTTP